MHRGVVLRILNAVLLYLHPVLLPPAFILGPLPTHTLTFTKYQPQKWLTEGHQVIMMTV